MFYICLMAAGDYRVAGFELGDLRPFGSPSLANLIEIPIAAALGGVMAVALLFVRLGLKKQRKEIAVRFVKVSYLLAVLIYLLFPGLPE